jgi:hypothetical protein
VRTVGCHFSSISARKNWSFAVAVVAPAYCGIEREEDDLLAALLRHLAHLRRVEGLP